jgi:hypothetical protein
MEPWTRSALTYASIDAVEYCYKCDEPLALIELAEDTDQELEATTVMQKLAAKSSLPAYIVFYRKGRDGNIIAFRVKQVHPQHTDFAEMTPDQYVSFLRSLRAHHICGDR